MDKRATQDLTFIATRDLIDELKKRNDAFIFLGLRFEAMNKEIRFKEFLGHRYVLLGMLSNLESIINDQLKDDERE